MNRLMIADVLLAVSNQLDLWLRIEDADGKVLAEDDESGSGTTPHVEVDVIERQVVRILVARSASIDSKGVGRLSRSGQRAPRERP